MSALDEQLRRSFQLIACIQHAFRNEDKKCALIGGHAVRLWGGTRSTNDLDLAVYIGDAFEPFLVLKRVYGNIEQLRYVQGSGDDPFLSVIEIASPVCFPIQVLNFDYRQEYGKAANFALEDSIQKKPLGVALDVCSLESLLALKMLAGGPVDRQDVVELVNANEKDVDYTILKQILAKAGRFDLFDEFFE